MIEVRRLCKRYGNTLAVDDLSFTVETGTICGLLGPNGAGKSTTMNIMTGCLAATSGEVRYDGLEIYEDTAAVKRRIGYLPEQPPLYPDMTVYEYLRFVGLAKGLTFEQAELDINRIEGLCGIEDVLERLIKNLSKGYKQRVGIAQALLGDPEIIILDEPTSGLDPLQIREIRDLVKRLSGTKTILVSSHILSEIQLLCDQIVIISKGRIVADDTPEHLESRMQETRTITVSLLASERDIRAALEGVESVAGLSFATQDDEDATVVTIEAENGADLRAAVSRACAEHGIALLEMSTRKASLEDIFVEATESGAAPAETDDAAATSEATADTSATATTTAATDAAATKRTDASSPDQKGGSAC